MKPDNNDLVAMQVIRDNRRPPPNHSIEPTLIALRFIHLAYGCR